MKASRERACGGCDANAASLGAAATGETRVELKLELL
jgi:hypothetical protein